MEDSESTTQARFAFVILDSYLATTVLNFLYIEFHLHYRTLPQAILANEQRDIGLAMI